MSSLRLRLNPSRPIRMVTALVVLAAAPALASDSGANPFVIVNRTIIQSRGDWQVDYQIRHDGATGRVVSTDEITAQVEGWVSNSRAAGHAVPRRSSLTISSASGRRVTTDVIPTDDADQRCRERATLRAWIDDGATPTNDRHDGDESPSILNLAPGAILRVRLILEHQHAVYGDYDPLLGQRTLELGLGAATLRDVLPLDREQTIAQPPRVAFDPPENRRDRRYFTSPPDSFHLEAHVPGNEYLRFPEIPVRYSSALRLRFWYLIAEGTEGACLARIIQYKDSPFTWKVLHDSRHEIPLVAVGRWTCVDRVIRTEPEATTLALDFRIAGATTGELWIDDVTLEPIGSGPLDP